MGLGWDRDEVILKDPNDNEDKTRATNPEEQTLIETEEKKTGDPDTDVEASELHLERRKHYRKFYNMELEKVTEVLPVPSPF
jgi:hypothetical protein